MSDYFLEYRVVAAAHDPGDGHLQPPSAEILDDSGPFRAVDMIESTFRRVSEKNPEADEVVVQKRTVSYWTDVVPQEQIDEAMKR